MVCREERTKGKSSRFVIGSAFGQAYNFISAKNEKNCAIGDVFSKIIKFLFLKYGEISGTEEVAILTVSAPRIWL